MKTNYLPLLCVAALPVIAGCAQATSASEDKSVTPAPAATNSSVPAPAAVLPVTNAVPAVISTGLVVNVAPVIPDTVKLTPAAAELAKLAQAGISPGVMVAYVTNSVNTFNLSADEIVYLNDLGLAPEVVTAMIQQDQRIREASLQGAMAASPATPQPGTSVWSSNPPVQSNVWQQTMPAPAPTASEETTAAPPPPEALPDQATVDYFYSSLAPYGTWIDIEGYGRVWRPTVAVSVSNWQPYQHGGRWIWTDFGWYWYSDYTWGWAPYHYGRWFAHPYWGWCWMPGSVWGPAWVTWRYSDAYCGWAPLPPAAYYSPGIGLTYYGGRVGVGFGFGLSYNYYTYVSYNHFHGGHYDRHCKPKHESRHVHQNTRDVNNVIIGDNNTIINGGVAPDRIAAVTRTEIPRVNIREQTPAGGRGPRGGRNEQLAPDGRTLTVTRSEIPGTKPGGSGRGPREQAATTVAAPTPTSSPTSGSVAPGRVEPVRSPGTTGGNNVVPGGTRPVRMAPLRETPAALAASPNVKAPTSPGRGGSAQTPASNGGDAAAPATPAAPTPSTPSQVTRTTPLPANAPVRGEVRASGGTGRSVIYINSRTGRPISQNTAVTPGTLVANTPATPWADNKAPGSDGSSVSTAPTPTAPVVRENLPQSVPRNSPIYGRVSPGGSQTVAPTTRILPANAPVSVAPRVTETPAAPRIQNTVPRTLGAPAPPQPARTYTPPVRSYEPRQMPANSPVRNYTPPERPSVSRPAPAPATAPARSTPSSAPSSPSRGSSGGRGQNDR